MNTLAASRLIGGARATARTKARKRAPWRLPQSPWLWCALAVLLAMAPEIASGFAATRASFGDTDDAARLVQVREWLAGAGWYDMLLPRFGGATPLVSHWSRLVDVPIAGLLAAFRAVLSPDAAELAARIVWPSLLFLVFLRLVAHEVVARGYDTWAAVATVAMVALTLSGTFQFRPGRLDHHNVMILLTVIGLLMVARSAARPRLAGAGGAMLGLALVVGYEPLMLTAPVLAVAAIAAMWRTDWLRAVRNAAFGLVATLALGLIVTAPPSLWHLAPCDALGINLVLLATAGAIGLALIDAFARTWAPPSRLAMLTVSGAAGVMLYTRTNPACLRGPFGEVSSEAIDIWLKRVTEAHSVLSLGEADPAALAIFLFVIAVGGAAAVLRWRRERTTEALLTMGLLLLALAPPFVARKFVAYASFLAVFATATWIAGWPGARGVSAGLVRAAGYVVLSFATVTAVVTTAFAHLGLAPTPGGEQMATADSCSERRALAPLDRLPRGLVVAPVDLGPAIVALTRHDALAAPYHRIDHAIVATHRIRTAELADAEARLRAIGADYVVECLPKPAGSTSSTVPRGTPENALLGHLAQGRPVPFLEEVMGLSPDPALRVWRVRPPS